MVSTGTGQVAPLFTIAAGTVLAPGQHWLAANASPLGYSGAAVPDQAYSGDIPGDGGLALISPPNIIVNQVGLSLTSAFRAGAPLGPLPDNSGVSYERRQGGAAGNCLDTANNASDFQFVSAGLPRNRASAIVLCPVSGVSPAVIVNNAGFDAPFFRNNIKRPDSVTTAGLDVVLTNLFLALVLAFVMAVTSTLVNDALESSEFDLARFLGPLAAPVAAYRRWAGKLDDRFDRRGLAWLRTLFKLLLALALYGIVFAFLDPTFAPATWNGLLLILALALSVGLIGIVDDVVSYLYLQWRGEASAVDVHPGNLVLAVATTLFSRGAGLAPGLIFGSPAGIELEQETRYEGHLHVLAMLFTGLVALAAWLLSPLAGETGWWATTLLLIFATGVQTLFFEMMPLTFLHGRGIYKYSRLLWLVFFVAATWAFFQTMLNPNGVFLSAFNSPDMQTLGVIVMVYSLASLGLWLYLRRRAQARPA